MAGLVVWFGMTRFTELTGRVASRIFMPGGASSPAAPDYSYQDSLVVRGEVDAAIRSYEALLAERESATVLLRTADLYTRPGRDAARAIALYRRARDLRACSTAQELYATNRLIDVFLATPGDERRALTELRRLADRHPDTREGAMARASIARLRASLE